MLVQFAREEADRRRHDVHVLGHRYVQREPQDDGEVQPPEDALERVGRVAVYPGVGECLSERTAYEGVRVGAVPAGCHVERLGEQGEEHQAGDEQQDDGGLALLGKVEAKTAGLYSPAADGGPDQDYEEHDGEYVEVRGEYSDTGVGEYGFGELGPDGVGEYVEDVTGGEGEESPEDEEVRRDRRGLGGIRSGAPCAVRRCKGALRRTCVPAGQIVRGPCRAGPDGRRAGRGCKPPS